VPAGLQPAWKKVEKVEDLDWSSLTGEA
jgi:hypothetical protein